MHIPLKSILCILFITVNLNTHKLSASINDYYPYDISPSASNYGITGLLEMPNARFMREASLKFNFSSSFPNEYTSLTASPFPWFESTFRYTEIKNQLYGPSAYSGNQSWKDKGFDLKFRINKEKYFLPQFALGLRDIAGTGTFSSEYLVATKSIGNFDITAGLGWGVLGADNNIKNPLAEYKDRFEIRSSDYGDQGGDFNYLSWFSGDTALFGGIEYNLHKYGLRFVLEYDTSNPDINKFNPTEVRSRINAGVNYFFSNNLDLGLAFERGTNFRVSFSLKGNFLEDNIKKPRPKNLVKLNKTQQKRALDDKNIFYRSLNRSLVDEKIFIQGSTYKKEKVSVSVATPRFTSYSRTAGRTAGIVSALSSDETEFIEIHLMNGDLELAKINLDKKEFDKAKSFNSSPNEVLKMSDISSSSDDPLYMKSEFMPKVNFPEFNWSMSPALKHQIGGPEGFYLGQLFWKTDMSLKLRRNFTIYSSVGLNIYDTFKNFNNPSASTIPHVRSDIQDYLREGKNNIQRFQLEYMYSPLKDIFIRADIGLLEEMFGGIGGEIFYRPFEKRYSFGLTLHKVKQRGYQQRFKFKDYENITGHLSLYTDLPYGITSKVSVGEYLAGDKGASLDLSRRFKSGFVLGVFATKTNISAEEFGEGSFDKGFYLSVPTQLFYSDFRTGNISFGLHPLTKDGGATLNLHNSLFGIVADSSKKAILRDWQDLME